MMTMGFARDGMMGWPVNDFLARLLVNLFGDFSQKLITLAGRDK